MPPVIEKRNFERFDLSFDARVIPLQAKGEAAKIAHRTVNISAGGAYFKASELFIPAGVEVSIRIYLPELNHKTDQSRSIVELTGIILRTDEFGMAAKFDRHYAIHPRGSENHE